MPAGGLSYRVPEKHLEDLCILYEMEAGKVTHSPNIAERFDVWWTENQLIEECEGEGRSAEQASSLIDWMWENGRLVPSEPDESCKHGFRQFRTDTCDLIRNSTFTYPRMFISGVPQKPSQAGVTWRVERKLSPDRTFTLVESRTKLENELGELCSQFSRLSGALDVVFEALENSDFTNLAAFQIEAAAQYLRCLLTGSGHAMYTAGTGSGKTLGFQLSVIISLILNRMRGGYGDLVYAFVFPRVALAMDQSKSLRRLCSNVNKVLVEKEIVSMDGQIRIVMDAGTKLPEQCREHFQATEEQTTFQRKEKGKTVRKDSTNKSQKFLFSECQTKPDIVVTNPDTLRRRLWYPEASVFLRDRLRGIVLDEIHLYEGMTGANYSNVIRRLLHHGINDVSVCGVSATVADPSDHMSNVVGVRAEDVSVISPKEEDLVIHGVVHHVLHSSVEGSSYISNLTNLTSLQQHIRHRGREEINAQALPPNRVEAGEILRKSRKAISFSDSLEMLGRWRYFLTDNEGIIPSNPGNYHWRFSRPLTHLNEVDRTKAEEHCDSCSKSEQSMFNIAEPIDVNVIPHTYTGKAKKKLTVDSFTLEGNIGITDDCPFFVRGLCWRPETPSDRVEIWSDSHEVSSHSIVTTLITSKTMEESKRRKVEIVDANDLYRVRASDAVRKYLKNDVDLVANIALSSPSMEVGVDLDNLTDAVLFKAIRNVASYRQKVGRLGRERGVDALSQTLVSFRPLDYHYYQNPVTLLTDDHLDSIPIATENQNIRWNRAYEGIFDYLSSQKVPFLILVGPDIPGCFHFAKQVLHNHGERIIQNLSSSRYLEVQEPEARLIHDRVLKVFEYLTMYLGEVNPPLITDYPKSVIQANSGSYSGPQRFVTGEFYNRLSKFVNHIRKKVPVIMTELDQSMQSDAMSAELVDVLASVEFITKPKGWVDDDDIRLEDLDSLLTEEMVREFAMDVVSGKRLPVMDTLQSLNDILNSLTDLREELNLIKSEIWNRFLTIFYWNEWFDRQRGEKILMFDQLVNIFHFSKSGDGLGLPPSLYSAPGTKEVELIFPNEDGTYRSGEITIDEAMRHYLPGHFSYRERGRPMKTRLYKTPNMVGDSVHINLSKLTAESLSLEEEKGGHEFPLNPRTGGDSITASDLPWGVSDIFGLEGEHEIKIREIRKIILTNSGDRKDLNYERLLLSDGDDADGETTESERRVTNLPQSHGTSWSRIKSHTPRPKRVIPFNDYNKWKDIDGDNIVFEMDSTIPAIFDSVISHDDVRVDEFSVGLVRRYTGVEDAVQFWYTQTENGVLSPTALGDSLNAPALEFILNQEQVNREINHTVNGILDGTLWEEGISFLRATLSEDWGVGPFSADHILRMILDRVDLRSGVHSYREALVSLSSNDVDDYAEKWSELVSTLDRKPMGINRIKSALEGNREAWSDSTHVENLLNTWARRSLAHGMGISLLQAGRAFTGCRDEDLGIHVDVKDEEILRLWLYDRTNKGNGSCQLIEKFFQIPKVLRHLRANPALEDSHRDLSQLPSKDFNAWMLHFLKPCYNHQSRIVAFAAGESGVDPNTHLPKIEDEVDFLKRSYNEIWSREEIDHDPAKLMRLSLMRHFDCEGSHEISEELKRASEGCWTSCPKCLEELGISPLGPLVGPLYSNKRQLDRFVHRALEEAETLLEHALSSESLAESMSYFGEYDLSVIPIDLRKSNVTIPPSITTGEDGDFIMRPLAETEHIQQFVDINSPLKENGEVNIILRTILTDSTWRKA